MLVVIVCSRGNLYMLNCIFISYLVYSQLDDNAFVNLPEFPSPQTFRKVFYSFSKTGSKASAYVLRARVNSNGESRQRTSSQFRIVLFIGKNSPTEKTQFILISDIPHSV